MQPPESKIMLMDSNYILYKSGASSRLNKI
jgi:hypothetical protein